MFNRKLKRQIEIQKQQIANRDKLIEYQQEKVKKLSESELTKENLAVHEENKDLRNDIETLIDFARHIKELAYTQQYGSVINLQNKIKSELDCLNQQI